MIYNSQEVIVGRVFANLLLGCLGVVPGAALLAAGKLRLSQDPAFGPNADTTLASLAANEATFSGYVAGGAAVVLVPGLNLSPTCQGTLVNHVFVAVGGGPFVPNTITGWWIDDGTNMVVAERFANGLNLSVGADGDYVEINAFVPQQLDQKTS